MSNQHHPASEYRWVRKVSALLLIALVVVIVVLDVNGPLPESEGDDVLIVLPSGRRTRPPP